MARDESTHVKPLLTPMATEGDAMLTGVGRCLAMYHKLADSDSTDDRGHGTGGNMKMDASKE